MAGAKAYAAKLKISPRTTVPVGQLPRPRPSLKRGDGSHTANDACPPQGIPQVDESLALEAMSFLCLHQSLEETELVVSVNVRIAWTAIARSVGSISQ